MEHLAAWKALTPIYAADQGVTAITRSRLVDATKVFPICQNLMKPIRTRLHEEKDRPEQLMPYLPNRCRLTETEGVIRSGDRTVMAIRQWRPRVTPANLRQEALNTLHTGHTAVTTMLTKATQEVIDIKAANKLVTGNLGPQDTLHTNWFARALLPWTPTPLLLPNPTHQQGSSCQGPHFQGFSCRGLQPTTKNENTLNEIESPEAFASN